LTAADERSTIEGRGKGVKRPPGAEAAMGDKTVTAEEARERIKHLLDLVKNGEEVLISEDDEVFARIAPVEKEKEKKRRTPGLFRGTVRMAPDFDDPLPDSFWFGEE
jgi:antitoxin (DNA-binding transcriptional repressor) of toxin-antitoxin stability system